MATLAFIAGFEQGLSGGLLTGVNGSKYVDFNAGTVGTNIQVLAAAAKSSDYGLRVSGSNNNIRWASDTFGTVTSVVAGFWWRPSTDPSGSKQFLVFYVNGVSEAGLRYNPTSNKIESYGADFTSGTGSESGTTNPNDWRWIDIRYDCANNPHTMTWSVDGVSQGTCSAPNATTTMSGILFGDSSSGVATGASDYDDGVFSTTAADYPLGPHKVVCLTVDPAGTVTLSGTTGNFQTFSGATPTKTAWNATTARDAVDERPPNVTSAQDGWCQITNAASDYVQMPMTTYTLQGLEEIRGARLVACGWSQDATGGFLGLRSFNGTTETNLFGTTVSISGNNTSTPWWVAEMLTLADINTQSELDALAIRGGFSSDATPDMGVHAVYVEVAIFLGNVLQTPATVAAVVADPGAHPAVGAGPAVAANVVALPQATPSVTSGATTATPATVAAVAALARPDVNVAASPAVAATVAAPLAPLVNVAAVPAVWASVVALPRPAVNTAPSPVVLAAVVADPGAHPNVVAVPGVLAALVALPGPTVIAGGNASPVPATVAAVVAILAPAVNVRAAPLVWASVVALSRPLVGTAPVPAAVVAVAALARPAVNVQAGPAVWASLVALARPNVAVVAVPAGVIVVTAVVAPVVVAGASVVATPATVDLVVAVLAVTAGGAAVPGPAVMSGVDLATGRLYATDAAAAILTAG